MIDKIDPAFRRAMRDKLTTIAEWEPSMGPLQVIPEGEDSDGK